MRDFNGLSCRVVFCLVVKNYVHLEVDGIVLHSIISVDGVDGCTGFVTAWQALPNDTSETCCSGLDGLS